MACAATVTLLPALGGCAFQQHREELAGYAERGDYAAAIRAIDEPRAQKMYRGGSELLYDLDRGALALASGDPRGAIEYLERADARIEIQNAKPPQESIGQWLINDTVATYRAEPYEEIYVNVMKLVAQLALSNVDGGATVEARRLARKTTELRDRFVSLAESARRSGKDDGNFLNQPAAGDFIESPLGTYLAAITFIEAGDRDFAEPASKRLLSSIDLQRDIVGPVSAKRFEGIASLRPDDIGIVFVAFAGRGPTKVAERVGPFFIGTAPVYFEIPRLVTSTSRVASVHAEIEPSSGSPITVPLDLVEDIGRVSTLNHERHLPLIYARTFARAAAKAVGSAVATEALRKGAADSDQVLVQIGGALAGMIVMGATERADTRAWTFLPGLAFVAHANAPTGPCRARIVYSDHAGGAVYTTAWSETTITDRGVVLINTWYPD